jgi:hypothetical protein
MKSLNLIVALGLSLPLSACSLYSPVYFGSKFAPTNVIEAYYSTKDIGKPFEIIGHMNASTGVSEYSQRRTKLSVIEKAKEIGADGVVFSELNRQVNKETTDDYSIQVDVIKFK